MELIEPTLNKLQQETAVFSAKFLEEVDRVLGEKK